MKPLLIVLFLLGGTIASAQDKFMDSLRHQLPLVKQDTNRVWVLAELGFQYRNVNLDSSRRYLEQALALTRKLKFLKGEARVLCYLGTTIRIQGDLPKSLETLLKGLQIAEANGYRFEIARCLNNLGIIYGSLGESQKALVSYQRSLALLDTIRNKEYTVQLLTNISLNCSNRGRLDSALYYSQKAHKLYRGIADKDKFVYQNILFALGDIQKKLNRDRLALTYYQQAIQVVSEENHRIKALAYNRIADVYKKINKADSCRYFAEKALVEAQLFNYPQEVLKAGSLLSDVYEAIDTKEAFRYYKMATAAKDSLYGVKKVQELQRIIAAEQEHQLEREAALVAYQNKIRQYVLVASLVVLLTIAYMLYRNNRQKQKANQLLHRQKAEISRQREKAETALSDLKATQTQLIQREKMASLGELTAGIAHEIQNPLNFVNNLSEVSTELIEELEEEIRAGHTTDALDLTGDLRETLEKVNHHGKRADSIVKGMLQHSRASSGQKELTDLNALADEYLRLAYQNLKAKDQDFTADLQLNLDPSLGKINIAPQDIGRVLLNLYNNAFYAVQEQTRKTNNGYQPQIEVSTHRENGRVELRVKDNGTGIPQEILSKIYQPFFTTKPTGQGTGLGLSLSYDIVTKGHGGEMTVESQAGEQTIFSIKLPQSPA